MKKLNEALNMGQKKKLLKIFLKAVGITSAVCIVTVGIVVGAYYGFIYDGKAKVKDGLTAEEQALEDAKQQASIINQTIAVFGTDEDGTRTDVIFVVNLNSQTNKVKVLAIPRDTKVQWSETQRSKLKEYKGLNVYTSKINEMTAYGGMDNIRDFTVDQIENMLGVKIDNYIIINLEAFRKIVDTIGGVEVDVPRRMRYTDRAQNLYINLDPGLQMLDGAKAEQLVRFRQYANGDVDRIQVQQLFLKAFAQKVMSPQTITKIPQFIPILFSYIKTDISLTKIASYYPFLQSFNLNGLSFNTIPGEGRYESGVSYFFPDRSALDTVIQEVFFDTSVVEDEVPQEDSDETIVIDKTVTIEVLNATRTRGVAGTVKDRLEKEGYQVQRIDNYTQSDWETTTIYTKDIKKASQFKQYFNNAKIEINASIGYDVQIIIGKDYAS